MGFVEIISLALLLLIGVAGVVQGAAALTGRFRVRGGETPAARLLGGLVFLAGGLSALGVGVLWLLSL